MTLRTTAKGIFLDTLRHLSIDEAMRTRVRCESETLHVGESAYDLQDFDRVVVIAIGKAAETMWDALWAQLEPALRQQMIEAIVVGATVPQEMDDRVQCFPGSHPLPSQVSVDGADAVLKLLGSCDDRCLVFFLISGGASAMIEKALDGSFTVDETAEFYRSLVHSGLAITQMNALRKHFSQVKGGRLAVAAQGATQCTLLISDVPERALHVVGSGPSLPDPSTTEDCRRIVDANVEALNLSAKLLAFFRDPALEETPKADHPAFHFLVHAPFGEHARRDLLPDVAEIHERKEGAGRLLGTAVRISLQIIQALRKLQRRPGSDADLVTCRAGEHVLGQGDRQRFVRRRNGVSAGRDCRAGGRHHGLFVRRGTR